ncbi:hypothetical protein SAY87_002412 [Trapa incisa]|uniref:PRONE domain-containing protein n=1 Tax=Trapa incisa TaxID=236973 RepID=A0AAN7PV87_9MYRT|nr:hypothetical protein SAY87_002412 [Trapa incisa]
MVREEQEGYRSKLFSFRGMHNGSGHHMKSLSVDEASDTATADYPMVDDTMISRSQGSTPLHEVPSSDTQQSGWSLHRSNNDKALKSHLAKEIKDKQPSDFDLMKERFSKLLLGEDMSGGGKGVSSALALSNAITNLAASVFGEQRRLEPMQPERKARWKREIDWLLSVTDHIVEFVPSVQMINGINMEIMTTRQRTDLLMNIPALRKLDAMLLDCLDNFKNQNEFYYVSKDANDAEKKRKDDKWWLPTAMVPPEGLSKASRKCIQFQKDSVNQVLKAAMAINTQVLSEMEIPENYMDSLPKNGRASLGDSIYKGITVEYFDPEQFLCTMDLSSEHKILDLKNRIEASIVIWKRKMISKDTKSSWSSAVSLEKRELFEERAETVLLLIKQRFPGIPQSALDISKIQYNRDVGQAVLESYSRILESLAYTVLSRIDDVLQADQLARNPSLSLGKKNQMRSLSPTMEAERFSTIREDHMEKAHSAETPTSMTLSDFMGWDLDQGSTEVNESKGDDLLMKDPDGKHKFANLVSNKISYIEKLEHTGLRSPTARD